MLTDVKIKKIRVTIDFLNGNRNSLFLYIQIVRNKRFYWEINRTFSQRKTLNMKYLNYFDIRYIKMSMKFMVK